LSRASKLALSSIIVFGVACRSQREIDEQQSAARVARAIELVREAPNAAKAGPLTDLANVSCIGAEVCKARDACAAAYTEHVEAVTLTAAAKQKLADGDAGEAAKLLNASEQKLTASAPKVTACTDLEASLRRQYKL
jgi:hypothetical protein